MFLPVRLFCHKTSAHTLQTLASQHSYHVLPFPICQPEQGESNTETIYGPKSRVKKASLNPSSPAAHTTSGKLCCASIPCLCCQEIMLSCLQEHSVDRHNTALRALSRRWLSAALGLGTSSGWIICTTCTACSIAQIPLGLQGHSAHRSVMLSDGILQDRGLVPPRKRNLYL